MTKRQARATSRQIEALVTYLEQHPHVASGKFYTLEGKNTLQGNLQMLAEAMKLQAEALVQLGQVIDKFINKETSCDRNIIDNEY
ncbi:hypothetical protein EAG_10090 [Camponotus floridanus]|uniref:Uncharacterized protein n=1 Tax=Camponotus floridanus TaxID=104421 RepID=E2A4H6_CAMFO|nr:hypothetical protein EAG_10090 [Camponotus floridanus]